MTTGKFTPRPALKRALAHARILEPLTVNPPPGWPTIVGLGLMLALMLGAAAVVLSTFGGLTP